MKTADFPSFFRGFEGPQPWNGPPCGGFQAPHLAPGGDQLLRHAAVAIAQGTVAVAAYANPIPCTRWKRLTWLVVDLPLWKNDGIRQLGSWHSQLNGKNKIHVPNHQPANSLLWKMDGKMVHFLMYLWNMVICSKLKLPEGKWYDFISIYMVSIWCYMIWIGM